MPKYFPWYHADQNFCVANTQKGFALQPAVHWKPALPVIKVTLMR